MSIAAPGVPERQLRATVDWAHGHSPVDDALVLAVPVDFQVISDSGRPRMTAFQTVKDLGLRSWNDSVAAHQALFWTLASQVSGDKRALLANRRADRHGPIGGWLGSSSAA